MRMCSSYRLKWGDKEERFQAGATCGWRGDESSLHILCGQLAMTLLPSPTWHILSRPHTNSHSPWQKFPLPVPVSPAFICFHTYKTISGSFPPHVALLNSWDADLLASVVQSHFQSVPPQRKSSLTPSSPRPSQNSSQCCRFYRESTARRYAHGRAHVWVRMSGCSCCFPFGESHHWEQTEGCFYFYILRCAPKHTPVKTRRGL